MLYLSSVILLKKNQTLITTSFTGVRIASLDGAMLGEAKTKLDLLNIALRTIIYLMVTMKETYQMLRYLLIKGVKE